MIPPPTYRDDPLDIQKSVQPVLIINGIEDFPFPLAGLTVELDYDKDNPLYVEQADQGTTSDNPLFFEQTNISVGARNQKLLMLSVAGTWQPGSIPPGAGSAASTTLTYTLPAAIGTGRKPFAYLREVDFGIYEDAALQAPIISPLQLGNAGQDAVFHLQLEYVPANQQFSKLALGRICIPALELTAGSLPDVAVSGGGRLYWEEEGYLIPFPLTEIFAGGGNPEVQLFGEIYNRATNAFDPGTIYFRATFLLEVWDDTGGNSAEYPFADGAEFTAIAGAFA